MKFIHLSDCHLGKYDRNLDVRFKDNKIAVKKVFEFAVREKVDFVVCSGDFFDNYRPTPDAIVQAFELLHYLKKNNIQFIVTEGNHDMKRGTQINSILNILKGAGLAKFVTIQQTPNGEQLESYEINGIKIYGLGYIRGSDNKAKLEKYASMIQGSNNIILIHIGIFGSDWKSKVVDSINAQTLGDIFKDKYLYIGLGHYHSMNEIPSLNIYQPGSTERWAIGETPKKYFFMGTYENGNLTVTKHEIGIRPWCEFIKEYNDWDLAIRELKNWVDINKTVRETDPERAKESIYPIYYIYLSGTVSKGYDGSQFDNIVAPIEQIVYAKINDIIVSKYSRSKKDWNVLNEEDMKKEILKEHFSEEFGQDAEKMVDLTMNIEELAESLNLSLKLKDNELNYEAVRPILEKYEKFISENPDYLDKKRKIEEEKSPLKKTTDHTENAETTINSEEKDKTQKKSSKKSSKKTKHVDLFEISKPEEEK